MAKSQTKLNGELRQAEISWLKDVLLERGEDVLIIGSNKIAFPCVDSENNDKWKIYTITVPTKEDDYYTMEKDYEQKLIEDEQKAKERAKQKEEKIAKDKARREKLAKAKENE